MEEEKINTGMSMIMDMCVALAIKAKIKPEEFVRLYTANKEYMSEYKKKMIQESLKLLSNIIK